MTSTKLVQFTKNKYTKKTDKTVKMQLILFDKTKEKQINGIKFN
jgi:hypothetical protein